MIGVLGASSDDVNVFTECCVDKHLRQHKHGEGEIVFVTQEKSEDYSSHLRHTWHREDLLKMSLRPWIDCGYFSVWIEGRNRQMDWHSSAFHSFIRK